MKQSAIKDIFHGIKGHIETMNIPKEDIKKNMGKVNSVCVELKEKLSPDLLNLHQKFIDSLEKNWFNEVDFYFAEGFKLGLLIGIECMDD